MTQRPLASERWRDAAVPVGRLPMVGREAFIARLAAGEFDGAFPSLDVAQPTAPPHRPSCDRDALADALAAGNAALGNALDEATLAAIRGRGVMVIAGQQPGLLLGPMFTLLKAVTAVIAAERLGRVLDVPVVPAFWIASEDHDIEEVNRVAAGDQRLVLEHAALHRPGARPPVGRVGLGEHRERIAAFIEHVAASLPHGDAVRKLTDGLDFTSYATQFGQMLARLLRGTGIVLVDPEWLRDQTGPVLAEAARRWDAVQGGLDAGRRRLAAHDMTSPLESVKIFALDQWDGREAAAITGATATAIEREPARYSPSAALRPVVQDAVLPTIATVAGPTELLYLWEIDEIYAAMEVDRARLLPRLTATLIDDRTHRRAERLGLGLAHDAAIFDVLDRLEEAEAAPAAADDTDIRELERLGRELTQRLGDIDEPLERKAIEKAIGSINYRVQRVARRVRQRRLDRQGVGLRNLQRVADAVYPHRQLQERGAGVLEMVGRFGPDLIPALRALDVSRMEHHLLWMNGEPAGVKDVKEANA